MGFKEKMGAWFPGATGESEGQEAQRLARELQDLRQTRANIVMFQASDDRHRTDLENLKETDRKIAATVDRLKTLGIDVPPELETVDH